MSDLAIQHAIAELVPKGSRVLDLGCGNGAMLEYLEGKVLPGIAAVQG